MHDILVNIEKLDEAIFTQLLLERSKPRAGSLLPFCGHIGGERRQDSGEHETPHHLVHYDEVAVMAKPIFCFSREKLRTQSCSNSADGGGGVHINQQRYAFEVVSEVMAPMH